MPSLYPENPVRCDECSAHFQLSPGMATDGLACPECGGKRLFFNQPSPTQSDGTLRDMVDSDSQHDMGGNPLSEGTIMGNDGERPAWKRDNFSPSMAHVANMHELQQIAELRRGLPVEIQAQIDRMIGQNSDAAVLNYLRGLQRPAAPRPPDQGLPYWDSLQPIARNRAASMTERVVEPRTLNTEPYMPWTHEASIHTAGPAVPALVEGEIAAAPEEAAVAGGIGGAISDAASGIGNAIGDFFGGGASGVAKKIAPSLMKGVLGQGAKMLAPSESGGVPGGGMVPEQITPAPNMMSFGSADIPFLLMADLETPLSTKSVDEQEDDPHQQDQKQFSDGDDSPSNFHNPNNEDSGADGEDGVREKTDGYGFGENSPGLERMMMVLPLLLHYFESDESGEQDPIIRALHETLEKENPGYLNQEDPDGHGTLQMVIQQHKQPRGVHAGVNAVPPPAGVPAPAPVPQASGACPQCGGPMTGGSCPQCGGGMTGGQMPAGGASMPPQITANHIGPVTPEQVQAVAQLLISQGRSGEIEDMKQAPQLYAKELQQVQQNLQPAPPLVDPSQATPPAPMEQAPGAMPMPGPDTAGGQPMQPMASFWKGSPEAGDDKYFGGKPGASHEAYDAMIKEYGTEKGEEVYYATRNKHKSSGYGGDYLEHGGGGDPDEGYYEGDQGPSCPMCGGHSEYLGQLGNRHHFRCQSCGMDHSQAEESNWIVPGPDDDATVTEGGAFNEGLGGRLADANNRVPRCPKCNNATTSLVAGMDNDPDQGLGKCHNPGCGHMWKLEDPTAGEKTGGREVWAELANPVALPAADQHQPVDHQHTHDPTMAWVDNGDNELQANQVYELHSPAFPVPDIVRVVDVKPDALTVQLVGHNDSFAPGQGGDGMTFEISRQEAQLEHYTFVPGGDQQDMDDRNTEPPSGTPGLEQVPPSGPTTDQVADSYPNTSVSHVEDPNELTCLKCGSGTVDHNMVSPTRYSHECVRCAHYWETQEEFESREASVDLSWLLESSGADDFHADMERARAMAEAGGASRNLSSIAAKDDRLQSIKAALDANAQARTAGRHFTPGEKRELIDEQGRARNLGDLDLSNTHYDTRIDFTGKANEENVDDAHFALGM